MNAKQIESKFIEMGARLKVREIASRWQLGNRQWIDPVNYAVDIRRDRDGEFFELLVPTHLSETVEVTVLQSEPKQRHLLLLIRKTDEKPQLDRFLCGHDERNWFVAAVPGGASSVRQAMDAHRDPEPHDGQRGVPGLNKPSRDVHPNASRFAFPSCSSRAERPPDKRKTAERYRAGRPAFACPLRVGRPLSPGS